MEIKAVEKIGNYTIHYDNEYGLAISPIDYKKLEVTAKEMFEKYGEELIQDNEDWLIYSNKPKKGYAFNIEFNKKKKQICISGELLSNGKVISLEELKAINQQCKELGWYNG